MFPQSVREIDAHSQRNTGPAIQDRLSGISRHRRDVGWCASSVRCATAVDCGEHARSITTTKRASSAATSVDTATPDWTAACISRAVHGPTTRTTPRLYRCGCPTTAGRVRSRHRLLPFCASARQSPTLRWPFLPPCIRGQSATEARRRVSHVEQCRFSSDLSLVMWR